MSRFWPHKLASMFVSGILAQKYDLDAPTLRMRNPPMGSMPFFNNSATPEIRNGELILVAGWLLRKLLEFGVPLENGKTESDALDALVEAMGDETGKSSKIVDVIDEYYKFSDEA